MTKTPPPKPKKSAGARMNIARQKNGKKIDLPVRELNAKISNEITLRKSGCLTDVTGHLEEMDSCVTGRNTNHYTNEDNVYTTRV